jgi:hypothetical protein
VHYRVDDVHICWMGSILRCKERNVAHSGYWLMLRHTVMRTTSSSNRIRSPTRTCTAYSERAAGELLLAGLLRTSLPAFDCAQCWRTVAYQRSRHPPTDYGHRRTHARGTCRGMVNISKLCDHLLLFALIPALISLDSHCFSHLLGTYFGRQVPWLK